MRSVGPPGCSRTD